MLQHDKDLIASAGSNCYEEELQQKSGKLTERARIYIIGAMDMMGKSSQSCCKLSLLQ